MGVKDLAALIGTTGFWHIEGMRVPVSIGDARSVFGRIDVLICVDGAGSQMKWVSLDNVTATQKGS